MSATFPLLCRYCGGPIAKATQHHSIRYGEEGGKDVDAIRCDTPITDPADLKRFTNHEVLTWRYTDVGSLGRRIDRFSTWDGESYVDRFFCNGRHAKLFAYAIAREGRVMPEYNDALRALTKA